VRGGGFDLEGVMLKEDHTMMCVASDKKICYLYLFWHEICKEILPPLHLGIDLAKIRFDLIK